MKWDRISRRRALVWGGWGLVLLIGLAGLFVWHSVRSYDSAFQKFEKYVGSSKYEDYLREPVPDEQNAAVGFQAAAAALESAGSTGAADSAGSETEWFRTAEPATWSPAREADARDALARHESVLTELEAAAGRQSCVWPPGAGVDVASAGAMRSMLIGARLVRLLGFVGVFDADEDQVERSFRILGSLAECLYAQPSLTGSLVAAAVERSQLQVVHAAVSSSSVGEETLEAFQTDLERLSRVDRVQWAVAAEGAFTLWQLETGQVDSSASRAPFGAALSSRIAATLASRWVGFKAWSERPFEELVNSPTPRARPRLGIGGVFADIVLPAVRHGVTSLRANRALVTLALVAVEGRRHGLREGNYVNAFERYAEVGVLNEGDGSAVLIDSELESLLRAHLGSAGGGNRGAELTLDLTVWRLPPPDRPGS